MKEKRIPDLLKCINELFDIEFESVTATIKAAKKTHDDESVLMGNAYIMGITRAKDIINHLLKDVG